MDKERKNNPLLVEFVNCTPHAIVLLSQDTDGGWDTVMTLESSGLSFRAVSDYEVVDSVTCNEQEVEVRKRFFGKVTVTDGDGNEVGLPQRKDGTFYIVSSITAQAVPDRDDFLMVDGTVRDDSGRIIGCTGFAIMH